MTNLEAADLLDTLIGMVSDNHDSDYDEALSKGRDILKSEPCEDCISRQAVIDGINEYFHDEYYQRTSIQDCRDCLIEDVIKELPPVTPQPKTGNWIINKDEENTVHGHCSVCGWEAHYYEDDIIGMPYCPNCGCRMVESRESEDKE